MAITEKGGPEVLCSRQQQQETEAKTDLLLGLRECSVFIILCTNIFVHYSVCMTLGSLPDCDNANLNKWLSNLPWGDVGVRSTYIEMAIARHVHLFNPIKKLAKVKGFVDSDLWGQIAYLPVEPWKEGLKWVSLEWKGHRIDSPLSRSGVNKIIWRDW